MTRLASYNTFLPYSNLISMHFDTDRCVGIPLTPTPAPSTAPTTACAPTFAPTFAPAPASPTTPTSALHLFDITLHPVYQVHHPEVPEVTLITDDAIVLFKQSCHGSN